MDRHQNHCKMFSQHALHHFQLGYANLLAENAGLEEKASQPIFSK